MFVWLNNEPFGSVTDLQDLQAELKNIFDERERNGVWEETETPKSNKLEDLIAPPMLNDTVYILAEPDVDIATLATVANAIKDSGGRVRMPRPLALRNPGPKFKPDPLMLYVSIGKTPIETPLLPSSDTKDRMSIEFSPGSILNESDLTMTRLMGTVEVLPNGQYFFFTPQILWSTDDKKNEILDTDGKPIPKDSLVSDFVAKGRVVENTSISSELPKILSRPGFDGMIPVKIAIHRRAPVESLSPFLELIQTGGYTLDIQIIEYEAASPIASQ